MTISYMEDRFVYMICLLKSGLKYKPRKLTAAEKIKTIKRC